MQRGSQIGDFFRGKSRKKRDARNNAERDMPDKKIMEIVAFTGIHRKKLTIVEKINSFKIRGFFHSN